MDDCCKPLVDSLDDNFWCDLLDYSSLLDGGGAASPPDLYWNPQPPPERGGVSINPVLGGVALGGATSRANEFAEVHDCWTKISDVLFNALLSETTSLASECTEEQECRRKRGRNDQCSGIGSKACRDKMRREKLNDRFSELSTVLDPGRPMKNDKLAILGDAIRVLNQLKTESQEYRGMNDKLLEQIKTLKAEKNELREEKLVLKAEKEKIELQLKTFMPLHPPNFMPAHPPIYPPGASKMPVFPGYGLVPMWQYMPPSACDTSQDHKLRPPAA